MIHPHTQLRHISDSIGYGMFATRDMPMGTLTYVRDPFERLFSQAEFAALPDLQRDLIDRYCYTDRHGNLVLSWDHSKYVNHHCQSNTLHTAFGFEIAVRDIAAGEEITTDYSLFNIQEALPIACNNCPSCRGWLRPDDAEYLWPDWDERIQPALSKIPFIEQALKAHLDADTSSRLDAFLSNKLPYQSVQNLRWQPDGVAVPITQEIRP